MSCTGGSVLERRRPAPLHLPMNDDQDDEEEEGEEDDPLFSSVVLSEAEVSPFVVRRPTLAHRRRRRRAFENGALIRRSYSSREVSRKGGPLPQEEEDLGKDERRESGLRSAEDLLRGDDEEEHGGRSVFQMESGSASGKNRSSSASLFKTFGLKRTLTMNSIISNINKSFRFRRRTQSCRQDKTPRNSSCSNAMMSSGGELSSSTPLTCSSHRKILDSSRSRIRGLSNIDPKFTSQSGLCTSTDLETSRGSIRIQHLTALSNETSGSLRFPKIDHCAHFHYEFTEINGIQIELLDEEEELRSLLSSDPSNDSSSPSFSDHPNRVFTIQVSSHGKTWSIKRSIEDFYFLDRQTHTCIWDRKFSRLPQIPRGEENFKGPHNYSSIHKNKDTVRRFFSEYIRRFSCLAGPVITCGPVLNWFDLDNRGHRLLVSEDCAINTPAVAAAYAVKRYAKQATDEISFEVGDMISVIDMPPPDESIWWRGKRGFEVGFFPCECVEVIGDKVPSGLNLPGANFSEAHKAVPHAPSSTSSATSSSNPCSEDEEDTLDGGGGGASTSPSSSSEPTKPVLRKHGKLISFFRSFILSRPTRGKLKKSGILKERVFGCDLSEHLMNTAQEIPKVLFHCADFIETKGIIDGIYRLSGIASNIQRLRVTFDEDRVPDLHNDKSVLQDIHCVSSLLKMYFRELPNPICTYHLYEKFVEAAKSTENQRLVLLRDVVQQLPPPNYRTLEYLSRHLYRVSLRGNETGMTAKNVAIVWAPNLLRSKSLEVGGVAALQGVGVQAVVTEYLIRYCELIFSEKIPAYSSNNGSSTSSSLGSMETPKKSRPKSLAISTPTKLLSLEEARSRALTAASGSYVPQEQRYIEVGGGPNNLPPTYHTVIDLPGSNVRKHHSERASTRQRKSPVGWKTIFAPGKIKYKSNNKISDSELLQNNVEDESSISDGSHRMVSATTSLIPDSQGSNVHNSSPLRPVKSVESLVPPPQSERNSREILCASRPNSGEVKDEIVPLETVTLAILRTNAAKESPKTHSRSSSHDSYFERTPLSSHSFKSSKPSVLDSESPLDPKSSSLDLSEIQVNFELEENEMKIFSEDEDALMSTSFTSIDEDDDDVRPSFRRISRHNSRKSDQVKIPSFKGQKAGASPLFTGRSGVVVEASPKKKKSDFTPGTSPNSNLVKRSKIEPEAEEIHIPSTLPMSPSIKFIDDRPTSASEGDQETAMSEEQTKKEFPVEAKQKEEKEEMKPLNASPEVFEESPQEVLVLEEKEGKQAHRLSIISSSESEFSTNDMLNEGNLDKLVIAEVYSSPPAKSLLSAEEEIDQEEPSICTVKEISLDASELHKREDDESKSQEDNNSDKQVDNESLSNVEQSQESSYISSPTETSYSIAGATVSENESFSLTSFEDDFKPSEADEVQPVKASEVVHSSAEEEDSVTNVESLQATTYTTEEIIIRPFTHESVVAMEIDEDSNITFIKNPAGDSSPPSSVHSSLSMEVEDDNNRKELMTAMPVHVLEDEREEEEEEDNLGGHFMYQPIQSSSSSSSSYSSTTSPEERPASSSGVTKKPFFIRSNSIENDGRMSSQGIPELEAKLNESNLFKASRVVCKSEDFPKKLSKRRCEAKGGTVGDEGGGSEETPLVRRNSIHNVPYVDVNDPGTRERMERYKEERRSLLRAKYKAEDYRVPQSTATTTTTTTTSTSSTTNSSNAHLPTNSCIKKSPLCNRNNANENNHQFSIHDNNSGSYNTKSSSKVSSTLEDLKNIKNSDKTHNSISLNEGNHVSGPGIPNKAKPPLSPQKSSSNSFGLINEEVNVKERAAMFGSRRQGRQSKEEVEPKRKSLSLSTSNNNLRTTTSSAGGGTPLPVSRSRSSHSGHLDKSPVSPNKIKNIAALFEQKS